jgi:N-[(2S)-2-amino-2-carboxyethyl]-L-glutamate dehydrogenase
MRYLSDSNIKEIGINWNSNIDIIKYGVQCLIDKDYAQPIKPYLRFRDLKNRIIAMPAYIGGKVNMSGIKWIASFPDNIQRGIQRAHSVVVLNDTDSGKPLGILNSGSVSAIRTASVCGMILKSYLQSRPLQKIRIGIIGFGVIGQHHLKMCLSLLEDADAEFLIYDLKKPAAEQFTEEEWKKVTVVDSWEEAYTDADIFITTTCSKERYIDKKPKPGSLHLNVSLRDYKANVFDWFRDYMIVDDWDEVCRENTDVESFHKEKGLQKDDVLTIKDILHSNRFDADTGEQAFMFNPMGMAIFDIAISEHYLQCGNNQNIGTVLDD